MGICLLFTFKIFVFITNKLNYRDIVLNLTVRFRISTRDTH